MDVSIIIPTYNRLWSLPKAVESCRNTGCRVEIIVVDDGSTDGTQEWLGMQQDVISIWQKNQGKDWAVNRAFSVARGRYIKFLDSDDAIITDIIVQQFELAERERADLAVSGYKVVDESGNTMKARDYEETDDFIAQQLGESDGSHYSGFLFRRDFISDIPHRQEYGARDDRMFILEVALKKPKIRVLPTPGIEVLHHSKERLQFPNGLRGSATHYSHLTIYKKILGELAMHNELTLRRCKAACKILWPLAHWIANTHLDEACEVADWVYQLDPSFRPPEPRLLGKLYSRLGFRKTEKILRLRRFIKMRNS